MKRRELYLHIGMPKTATTALQHFFVLNRDVLKKCGVTYPSSGSRHAHHRLGWSINVRNGSAKWWFDKDLLDYQEEWRSVLTQLVSEKNLLSTEALWGFDKTKIALVKEMTSQFHIKVVIYIRRHDTLIDSWYNELVKIGIFRKPPEKCDKIISLEPIKQWSKFFGKENIIVRPYEKQQFYNGTIFSDFLHHVLGIIPTTEFILPKHETNPSLHRIALEYKRMVNFIPLSSFERDEILQPLQEISAKLQQKNSINYPTSSPQQRLRIYHEHNETYAAIAHEYLKQKKGMLFYDAPPDPSEEWQPYNSLTQEDARKINEFLAKYHPDQLATIVKGILYAQFSKKKGAQMAALKLLPGIPPVCINRVLNNMLTDQGNNNTNQQRQQLKEIYSSKTWKAGKIADHIFRKLPNIIKKPTLSVVRRLHSNRTRAKILDVYKNDE